MEIKPKFLNIACGDTFIQNENWINIDFTSHSTSIKKANILDGLPFKKNEFDVIYSSHFIEHIPQNQVKDFLMDSFRVLKPGGVIRFVTPDLEFLNNEYIKQYNKECFHKSDFITSLILDQCVRSVSGGKLKKDMDYIYNSKNKDMIDYVKLLVGPDAFSYISLNEQSFTRKVINKIKKDPKFLFNILFMIRVKFVSFFLPKTFRDLNISNASIGEKHMWLYDFNSLSNLLEETSFNLVKRVSFDSTSYSSNIFSKLDMKNSKPRKGIHQLFIEAIKA
tara:strand:+ start:247 stop:1080 length:834 start_codon:yes stop_codon:yes gene_type:complete